MVKVLEHPAELLVGREVAVLKLSPTWVPAHLCHLLTVRP